MKTENCLHAENGNCFEWNGLKRWVRAGVLGSLLVLGCSDTLSVCDENKTCPAGFFCDTQNHVGICVEVQTPGLEALPTPEKRCEAPEKRCETPERPCETPLLQVQMLLEKKSAWKRDEVLRVQLQSTDKVNWDKTELFSGVQRATREACPQGVGFPALANAACFAFSLSAFPNLPHGPYALELRAELEGKAGNRVSQTQSFDIQITRRLWTLEMEGTFGHALTTREGLLLMLMQTGEGAQQKTFVLALNTNGKEMWRRELPSYAGTNYTGNFLLGNHRGFDVLLVSCSLPAGSGFQFVNPKTGDMASECLNPQQPASALVLLQGGPNSDLVVARKILYNNTDWPATSRMEACRFHRVVYPSGQYYWNHFCDEMQVPAPYSEGILLARQTLDGVSQVLMPSGYPFCTVEWKAGEGWRPGFPACEFYYNPYMYAMGTKLLSAEHIWVYIHSSGKSGTSSEQTYRLNTQTGLDVGFAYAAPLLADVGDEWIGSDGSTVYPSSILPSRNLRRYSASGDLLFERDISRVQQKSIVLMEGGNFVLPGKDLDGNLEMWCLKPDLSDCWTTTNISYNSGMLSGVLPKSPTRSVVVLGEGKRLAAFLLDSPGLKTDAPWPINGHDLCRTFNANVSVNNCWDGPQ